MIKALGQQIPQIDSDTFIAESADIIGDVTIGPGSSIWYQAVLRGDMDAIRIGAHSNIQDGVAIHIDGGKPVTVGHYVTVGHQAIIHGCTIGDRVLIGMGAVILNGAVIEDGAVVAAGCVVKENMIVPANSMIAGVPGKIMKTLDPSEQLKREEHAARYEALWREQYRS